MKILEKMAKMKDTRKQILIFVLIISLLGSGIFLWACYSDSKSINYMRIQWGTLEAENVPCRISYSQVIQGNINYINSFSMVFSYTSNFTPISADCYINHTGTLNFQQQLFISEEWQYNLDSSLYRIDFVIIFNINNDIEFLIYAFYLKK